MASSAAGCRRADLLASCSRSRTTSDLEILRPRDSASISATSGSGKRTVSVFMKPLYYMSVRDARHRLSEGNASLATPLLSFRLNDDNNFVVPAKMPAAECFSRGRGPSVFASNDTGWPFLETSAFGLVFPLSRE